ncbi:MAG: GAF domain-containing protein, partial [bacterium]
TAEILRVISGSPTDVQPVFEAIAQTAHRLFNRTAGLQIVRDGALHIVATAGFSEDGLKKARSVYPMALQTSNRAVRAMLEGKILERTDVQAPGTPSVLVEIARVSGFRSIVTVPLLRGEELLGQLGLNSEEVAPPLDDKQRGLLATFADQAVIAIENVRLFNETKEALERQTATAEILKVISESPTDMQPVFDAIVQSCLRLFDGMSVSLNIVHGDTFDRVASSQSPEARDATAGAFPMPLDDKSLAGRAMLTGELVHIADLRTETWIGDGARSILERLGFRSALCAPMIREPFADQAVIAIENVRLFKELQQRTDALTKSVGQLTALGDVSQAISSTLDLEKVLPTIVSRAVQLTGLDGGAIYEYDEAQQVFTLRAGENMRQEMLELNRSEPIRMGEGAIGRAAATRKLVQVPDIAAAGARQTRGRDVLLRIGARALLAVPLLREGHILGALGVIRNTPGEFPPEVISLLETFATQSAIAIQNARLFREIEDKSRQLELASQHKSQFLASMSHELRTPLNAILGFNELIIGGIYGEIGDDMRPPLEQMQSSGKHLLSLINNVLDLAKIEANKMELALADFSVPDMVAMVRSTLQSLATEKGLELVVSVPEDLPLAHGDGGRLSQCLINLAGNAIKFTKEGRVEIRAALEDETLRFSVVDTGIGIPPEKIDSLFTEFKQTDATVASEYGGTGLGLSITKKFIEMHGGRIWVESEPGKGSSFIFEIPLRVVSGAAA